MRFGVTEPENRGVESLVMLSELLTPKSVLAAKSGATAGAAGAAVSIVTFSGADGWPVRSLPGRRADAVTANVPSAVNVTGTDQFPFEGIVPVASVVAPARRTTSNPPGPVPENV